MTIKSRLGYTARNAQIDLQNQIIPYIQAINCIQVDASFMAKEDLKRVKILPMRNWQINKEKSRFDLAKKKKGRCTLGKALVIIFISILIIVLICSLIVMYLFYI